MPTPPPPFFDFTFWQNAVSNGLATLIGVILGIPAALWLNNLGERSTEKEHKKKILHLLRIEIRLNYDYVNAWHDKVGLQKQLAMQISDFLKDESWRAFSDGGEIQWIKDPTLLSELSDAYYEVRVLSTLSKKYVDLTQFAGENTSGLIINKTYEALEATMHDAGIQLEAALIAIYKALDEPVPEIL